MNAFKRLTALLVTSAMLAMSGSYVSAASITDYTDPNGNGVWEVADAIYIMQYLAGAFEPTNLTQLDIDKNGVVSMMDAQSVQLYCAEMWDGEI